VDEPVEVRLVPYNTETYGEGETYDEKAEEVHMSSPEDGTVTIVTRHFKEDRDHAWVYWQTEEWNSAEPRPATDVEVADICSTSLQRWFV
jgi:hypothetical protein